MNRKDTSAVTFCVLAAISTAAAQTPAPGAQAPVPGAAGAAPTAPAATPPRLDMKPPARANRDVPSTADARGCLEFPNNQEIIKCAEKYLHRRTG